ncbi:MAG: alpha-maltose-phosphate synthase [Actinomycetota bacterium]|jgi:starch synthase|nr:alpha-maltose-phosphate synthase [Actinomycetota bacterium]
MRVALLTREYPPEVYGGAGVHAAYLTRDLARLVDLDVHCFGAPREAPHVTAHPAWAEVADGPNGDVLGVLSVDLRMAAATAGADVVHTHTWYANLGGHLAKVLHGIPHVMTTHSLEPRRPWKAEQLGAGYGLSSWAERTAIEAADAVIAVSAGMRADILETYPAVDPGRVVVIPNGIDPDEYQPDPGTDLLVGLGIDPDQPSVVFVGRMTRQKGIDHALEAAVHIDPAAQVILCAGAPDTPEIGAELRARAAAINAIRGNVVWVEEMVHRTTLVQILSHASVFLCPSVYEPFGITNLEAMACEVPVVASAVGGIPEVVVDGETGFLVPIAVDEEGLPVDPAGFARHLAARVNQLLADPETARAMGRAGRIRVLGHFSWPTIAARTVELYRQVIALTPGA